MKKRIFSALTALTLALSLMPSAFAAVTIYNGGHSNDPYKEEILMNTCYAYNGSPSFASYGTVGNAKNGTYLIFKDMNFGTLGAKAVTVKYGHKYDRKGDVYLYRATASEDGTTYSYSSSDMIASFTSTFGASGYTNYTPQNPDTFNPANTTGTFDLMVYYGSTNSNAHTNLRSFQFTRNNMTPEHELTVSTATTIPETVDTTNSVFNAVSQDNDGIHFAMDFGEGHTMDRLRANVSASGATGKIQLREGSADGTVIAELDVSNVSTTDTYTEIFNRISTEAKDFTGVHNLYVTYEGEGEVTIEKLWFKDGLNADIDVLDYTNHSETNSTLDSKNWFPMWSSNNRKYVKWSEVDFGEASVLRNLNIIMGTTSAYKGATLNVFIDGIEDSGTQIAEAVNRPEVSSWNDTDNYELVPVMADIKGFHDVYIYADAACPYLKSTKSLNVYSLDFTPETDNYNTYYNEYGDASTANHDLHHIVTFIPDETTPEKVGFLLALYNSNGRLVRADYKMTTPTEGVNAMTCTLDYTDLITNAGVTDTYTVKGIVWNALTLDPILTYEEVEVATINHTAS